MKVRPKSHLTWGKKEDYHIYVAKCATEGCQESLKAPDARKNMKIEILGERGGFEIELLREYYADCDGAKWPDPVVPDDGEFDLEAECNVTYLINVVTSADSVAGDYEFTVRLSENGEIYGEYPLTVTVWNFVLDRSEPMHTGAEIARNFMLLREKTDDPEGLYKKYYDFMLKRYHFCAYELPYDILDPRADEYLDNPEAGKIRFRKFRDTSLFLAVSTRPHKESTVWDESGKLEKFVSAVSDMVDFVIIDTAPVLADASTVAISKFADKLLMIVRTDTVKTDQINKTLSTLRDSGVSLAGCILNDVHGELMPFDLFGADETGSYYSGMAKYGKYSKYGKYRHYGGYGRYSRYSRAASYYRYSKKNQERK